jgi:exodeoxyribonuclease III
MRVISWNVNGLRACIRKGFLDWLEASEASIVGLQEVRALPDQLPIEAFREAGWHVALQPAEKKGYSGVGILSRSKPTDLETSLGVPELDREGRLQIARFGDLLLANVYFPNGSGRNRDNSRIPYKLSFYRRLFDHLEERKQGDDKVLVVGDFNTAHEDIDLARPRQNRMTSGFCDEERAELARWLANGWTDTFRKEYPDEGVYTWWSNRQGVREKNIGWRIDYILANQNAMNVISASHIFTQQLGSDHCPIAVDLVKQGF